MRSDYPDLPPLSSAAQQALDTLSKEFRDQVLGLAKRRAAVFREDTELSVGDIVRAADDVLDRTSRVRRYDGLTMAYLGFGAAIAAAGTIMLLLLTVGSPDLPQLIAAVLGVAGASVAGIGATMSASRKWRDEWDGRPYESLSSEPGGADVWLLSRWLELELAARDTVAEQLGESRADVPLAVLMEELTDTGILTSEDMETFRRVLRLRNQVAHRGGSASWEATEANLKDLDHLLRKIRRDHRPSLEREHS